MGYRGRDVDVLPIDDDRYLVIACDSCGAVGLKELDVVKVQPYLVGRFTTRGPLLEATSVGAVPVAVSVAICNEPEPTGEEILRGVREELGKFELGSIPLTISTEKNMVTRQTAVGITVIGMCRKEALRVAGTGRGDLVYCIGIPKVGSEVTSIDDPEIVQSHFVKMLLCCEGVHDILPVGSRGIRKEAEELAKSTGAEFVPEGPCKIDVNKSAGPSTCMIFTASVDAVLPQFGGTPVFKIGRMK